MTSGAWRPTTVLLLTFGLARLGAHDTATTPVVDVLIRAEGTQLRVVVAMPVAALSDVNLPRDPTGRLSQDLEESLQLVARDVAAGLDFEQGDERLALPTARARLAADAAAVTIDLVYLLREGAGAISARLQTFRAGRDWVPTVARFVRSPGVTRTFTQTGDAERVIFTPSPLDTVRQFLPRGARALMNGWSLLLFPLCLGVPFRRHRSLASASVAWLAGEGLASALIATGAIAPTAASMAIAQSFAVSTLVMASLQGVTGRLSRPLWPLAAAFGVASGVGLGDTFRHALPFAGDFSAQAYLCFALVVLGGQLWVLGVVSSAAGLLYGWGVPERLAAISVSAYAGHASLHALGDSAATVAESTTMTANQFLAALTLGWALVAIGAGILETVRVGGETQRLGTAGGHTR